MAVAIAVTIVLPAALAMIVAGKLTKAISRRFKDKLRRRKLLNYYRN
ncbi:hypothetical protein [Sphingomonas sp. S2-65]|nr:hypothetical protein [Sphingomonas sp. S2-65]UYY57094.1 hypothetical protein LZ586_10380 [Sphingomonas sp. S2-65]